MLKFWKLKISFLLSINLILIFTSILHSNTGVESDSAKFIIHNIEKASKDSMCVVDVDYPELLGLKNKFLQDSLNRFLKNEFLNEDEIDIANCDPDIGSTLEINCYIEYNKSDLISIVQYYYTYNGGAHGFYGHDGYNLDLSTGELLVLTDIIDSQYLDKLTKLIEEKMIEEYEVQKFSDIGLFEEQLAISGEQDFYLTPNALIIEFDPYEIGPYVMGDIDILLPWHEIEKLLTKYFTNKIQNQ